MINTKHELIAYLTDKYAQELEQLIKIDSETNSNNPHEDHEF